MFRLWKWEYWTGGELIDLFGNFRELFYQLMVNGKLLRGEGVEDGFWDLMMGALEIRV